jgi:hypothetical protein
VQSVSLVWTWGELIGPKRTVARLKAKVGFAPHSGCSRETHDFQKADIADGVAKRRLTSASIYADEPF